MRQETLTLNSEKNQGYLIGEVISIFFEAPASLYKVALVRVNKTDLELEEEITITGNFPELLEGTSYYFEGRIVEHPKYGRQFYVADYKKEALTTKEGVVAYLAGQNFEGIGQKTAEKIVQSLGEDVIEQILSDPSKVEKIGLTKKQKESLLEGITSDNGAKHALIGLNSLGLSEKTATKIFEKYREKSLEVVYNDPYKLSYDIDGFGFERADRLATKLDIKADAPVRLRAALFESMAQLSLYAGNTYTDGKALLLTALKLLEKARPKEMIDPQLLAAQILEMGESGQLVSDDGRIYLRRYYEAENTIAAELKRLMEKEFSKREQTKIKRYIDQIEEEQGIKYGADQRNAIISALNSPVFLLTGGPGTGKTTIINGIVQLFSMLYDLDLEDKQKLPILLAAPTGRAAKKMSESTGLPASTLHRLLGLNIGDDESVFEPKQLEGKLLIVDETSMVDTTLLQLLLESIPDEMQVIFVGDKDQLPSVGPGQVFSDLLASDVIAKKELSQIYRQGEGSTIISLSHAVKEGSLPSDLLQKTDDRSFIQCHAFQVQQVIQKVVTAALKKGNQSDDIQVLAPMYRGEAGINSLNEELQNLLNPPKGNAKELRAGNNVFRIGDRVLHLVNDPENNIFNGDIGKVVGLELIDKNSSKDKLIVSFDGNEVTFERNKLSDLTLAYCMSIHKSQGSEFPIVILPFVNQYARMFARNLLYTAMTRAKDKLILLGEPEAYQKCVDTLSLDRKTTLIKRLHETLGKQTSSLPKFVLTKELIKNNEIDPMIGMDDVTPDDFMN